jgi:hypothetical protein
MTVRSCQECFAFYERQQATLAEVREKERQILVYGSLEADSTLTDLENWRVIPPPPARAASSAGSKRGAARHRHSLARLSQRRGSSKENLIEEAIPPPPPAQPTPPAAAAPRPATCGPPGEEESTRGERLVQMPKGGSVPLHPPKAEQEQEQEQVLKQLLAEHRSFGEAEGPRDEGHGLRKALKAAAPPALPFLGELLTRRGGWAQEGEKTFGR